MAKARIATLKGVFLRPGVSKNKRLYNESNIGKAVGRIQKKIESGIPVTMYASHAKADADESLSTVGRVTKVLQNEDGSASFEADIPDTSLGRDYAALVTPEDPYLKGISIRGQWVGKMRSEESDGQTVMTADDLDIDGIDFTGRPGVEGAEITQAQLLESASDPTLIYESVEDPITFIHEEDPAVDAMTNAAERLQEAADLLAGLSEGGDAPGNGKKPYGNVTYADPGFKSDKKKRYPIDTEAHVRAAWAYINVAKNATGYTPAQVKNIKGKIKSAAKKFGIDIAAESADMTNDILNVLEGYASMSINNADGSVSTSGYCDEPEKLQALAAKISYAAICAMNAMDPDNDDDIDLGGAESSVPNNGTVTPDDNMESVNCPGCGAAVAQDVTVCSTCGDPIVQAESTDTEATVATENETGTQATESGAGLDTKALADAVVEAIVPALATAMATLVKPAEKTEEAIAAEALEEAKARKAADDLVAKEAADLAATEAATKEAAEAKEAADLEALEAFRKEAVIETQTAYLEELRAGGYDVRQGLATMTHESNLVDEAADDPLVFANMDRNAFTAEAAKRWADHPVVQTLATRARAAAGIYV